MQLTGEVSGYRDVATRRKRAKLCATDVFVIEQADSGGAWGRGAVPDSQEEVDAVR